MLLAGLVSTEPLWYGTIAAPLQMLVLFYLSRCMNKFTSFLHPCYSKIKTIPIRIPMPIIPLPLITGIYYRFSMGFTS